MQEQENKAEVSFEETRREGTQPRLGTSLPSPAPLILPYTTIDRHLRSTLKAWFEHSV